MVYTGIPAEIPYPVTHSDNTEYGAYPNGDVNDYGAVRGSSGDNLSGHH